MGLYQDQRKEQERRLEEFSDKYSFIALSEEHFLEGLKKLNLTLESLEKDPGVLVSIHFACKYMLADKVADYETLIASFGNERKAALSDPETGAEFAYDMFLTRLREEEYIGTEDPTDTLKCLGFSMQDLEEDPVLKTAFEKACETLSTDHTHAGLRSYGCGL